MGMGLGVAEGPEPPGMVGAIRGRSGSAVGLSFSRGNRVAVGTRVLKATGVTNIGFVGSGVDPCSRELQPIAVNNRIEEKAKHPVPNRSSNTTEDEAPLVLSAPFYYRGGCRYFVCC